MSDRESVRSDTAADQDARLRRVEEQLVAQAVTIRQQGDALRELRTAQADMHSAQEASHAELRQLMLSVAARLDEAPSPRERVDTGAADVETGEETESYFDADHEVVGEGDAQQLPPKLSVTFADTRPPLPSVELNPDLPRDRPAKTSDRRSTIMKVNGYEIEVDDTFASRDQKLNINAIPPPKCGRPASKPDMLRLQTEYTTYLQSMHRSGLNPLSLREVMGEANLDNFNQQYTQLCDARGVPDHSGLTTGDILRQIQRLREEQAKSRPEDVVPQLEQKLNKVWGKGPTSGRDIDTILGSLSSTLADHLRDHDRRELAFRPPTDAATHRNERKRIVKALVAALPERLQTEVQSRALLGNELIDNPQPLIHWMREHLPETERLIQQGMKSAKRNSTQTRGSQRNRNRRNNRESPKQETAKSAKSKLARSKRKHIVKDANVECFGCGEMGHPFLCKDEPKNGKDFRNQPWVQNCRKQLPEAKRLAAKELALKRIKERREMRAKQAETEEDATQPTPPVSSGQMVPYVPPTQQQQPYAPMPAGHHVYGQPIIPTPHTTMTVPTASYGYGMPPPASPFAQRSQAGGFYGSLPTLPEAGSASPRQ